MFKSDRLLAAENETKRRWVDGGYGGSYLEWMRDTVEVHRRFGLTESVFNEVVSSVEFMPRADATLARIHAWGVKSVLITGGFKALADRVQKLMRIHHALAACEYFFDSSTGLIHHANLLPADEKGKVDFMLLICREYAVSPSDCAFVGDGKNDCHLAREVGFSVAFNAQPELSAITSASISQSRNSEGFMAVADVIDNEFPRRPDSVSAP